MHVIFCELSPHLREGGLEKAASDLATCLRRQGCTIERLTHLPRTKVSSLPKDTIVHFHGLWSPAHTRASARLKANNIPALLSPHGMLEPWSWKHKRWKKLPYYWLCERHHMLRCRALVATGEQEAERCRKFAPGAPAHTISLGIDETIYPDYFAARTKLGWKPHERVMLYLSRIHPKKGLDMLLHALSLADFSENNPVRLVIVGSGSNDYVSLCRQLAIKATRPGLTIEWKDGIWGEERWPYLQGADLTCLPTHSENFGYVVLESVLVGTPVLTTTGTPWSLLRDQGSFICEPDTASIAEALADFLARERPDSQQRDALSSWTRKRYHWDQLAPAYIRLYQSILEGDRP